MTVSTEVKHRQVPSEVKQEGGREQIGTHCCWRLSWREQRVSQPGKGHLWLRSPVCTRAWRDRWPLVVNALEQTPQTCFFFPPAVDSAVGTLEGAQRSDGAEASKEPLNG